MQLENSGMLVVLRFLHNGVTLKDVLVAAVASDVYTSPLLLLLLL